jgi:hypothetical protein
MESDGSSSIKGVIWHIHKIKIAKIGRLFTYRASSVEKLKMFKVTLENYLPDPVRQAQMRKLYIEAKHLRGRRNTFAHGLWGRMPKEHKTEIGAPPP